MKVKKKPIIVEATRWFKNGDHPNDFSIPIQPKEGDSEVLMSEGKVVRYYRNPSIPGKNICKQCKKRMSNHGFIDTLEGGHIVCPGDWIITGIKGENYPCKPEIFEKTYEIVQSK